MVCNKLYIEGIFDAQWNAQKSAILNFYPPINKSNVSLQMASTDALKVQEIHKRSNRGNERSVELDKRY
jgi:hypothetical protein